jgi:hypothetical protein
MRADGNVQVNLDAPGLDLGLGLAEKPNGSVKRHFAAVHTLPQGLSSFSGVEQDGSNFGVLMLGTEILRQKVTVTQTGGLTHGEVKDLSLKSRKPPL